MIYRGKKVVQVKPSNMLLGYKEVTVKGGETYLVRSVPHDERAAS